MPLYHDLFSSGAAAISARAHGSFVNATYGGTGAPVFAGRHANHAVLVTGSFGNTGTIFAYAHSASDGGGTTAIGSIVFGSGNFSAAAFDITTDTLLTIGTGYAWVSGQVKVDSGGTVAGALSIISYNARTAGTTPAANGIGALGTSYV